MTEQELINIINWEIDEGMQDGVPVVDPKGIASRVTRIHERCGVDVFEIEAVIDLAAQALNARVRKAAT